MIEYYSYNVYICSAKYIEEHTGIRVGDICIDFSFQESCIDENALMFLNNRAQ